MFEELEKWILEIEAKGKNPEEFLNKVGKILEEEIKENFDTSGHGNWEESIRVKRLGGKTLIDTKNLYRSIKIIEKTNLSIEVGPTEVGKERKTDPRILGYLHEGGTIFGKPYLYFKLPIIAVMRNKFKSGKERKKPKKEILYELIRATKVENPPRKWAEYSEKCLEKIEKEFDKFISEN